MESKRRTSYPSFIDPVRSFSAKTAQTQTFLGRSKPHSLLPRRSVRIADRSVAKSFGSATERRLRRQRKRKRTDLPRIASISSYDFIDIGSVCMPTLLNHSTDDTTCTAAHVTHSEAKAPSPRRAQDEDGLHSEADSERYYCTGKWTANCQKLTSSQSVSSSKIRPRQSVRPATKVKQVKDTKESGKLHDVQRVGGAYRKKRTKRRRGRGGTRGRGHTQGQLRESLGKTKSRAGKTTSCYTRSRLAGYFSYCNSLPKRLWEWMQKGRTQQGWAKHVRTQE